ncbi:FKBP-type peptidyl-prolyl cis-trans isomerase [Endozoicomonas sp. GU-1]|uniref:FKBP-type peptidyl-prolyl cis-trans isomerase n=1 Tax=Endozoicomonas sp. GU-1 TaxID=3009078 RepID=UPI0022B53034|nr:FKBP-type peptidyl-prolyl cis-trans isomerase [Endozoicomonas sp. GU-1]WBA82669.1 FKBP-type peptidyl-prolyl cis-trans isomerase [Endozoicomonas sp. GU-1]WBA85601.1 FKBP-type peptidyl-prolyl cis-trans isomerase [Endozoicomonas sp. GU-1]
MSAVIEKGSKVTLHFSLKLDDGSVVDSTPAEKPASLIIGDGNLPEGFEETLYGLASGEDRVSRIPPEKAFGMPNPNNLQRIARGSFASGVELEEGLVMSFSDAANSELPGVVRNFDDEMVEVDFNHPLAGRHLTFEVQILDVETP